MQYAIIAFAGRHILNIIHKHKTHSVTHKYTQGVRARRVHPINDIIIKFCFHFVCNVFATWRLLGPLRCVRAALVCAQTYNTIHATYIFRSTYITHPRNNSSDAPRSLNTPRVVCPYQPHTSPSNQRVYTPPLSSSSSLCAHGMVVVAYSSSGGSPLYTLSILLYCYYCAVICISRLGRTPCGVQCVYIIFLLTLKGEMS